MKVHFVAVGEASDYFINMVKLLIYSLRSNGGIYQNAPFTFVTNGVSIPKKQAQDIQQKFDNVRLRTMPRLGTMPLINKYNAFYAVDDHSYDVMILIDCDIVILDNLEGIADLDCENVCFKATAAGLSVVEQYGKLLKNHINFNEEEIRASQEDCFSAKYPLFNSGMLVLSRDTVVAIRDDTVKLCQQLQQVQTKDLSSYLKYIYNSNLYLNKIRNHRYLKPLARYLLPTIGIYYPLWMSEQLGLAMAILKNKVPYEILPQKFNWHHSYALENGSLPPTFHYMKGKYKIDRKFMFEGSWIEEYLNSSSPLQKSLANTVKSYKLEYGN